MNGKGRFDKLLEPSSIGKVKTKNRMVKAASTMGYIDEGGYVNEKCKAFHEALARGGVGLIIVESTAYDYPLGVLPLPELRIDDDKFIPRFSELTGVIHKHGCPTFLQLPHAGPWYQGRLDFGRETGLGPSKLQPVAASSLTGSKLLEQEGFQELHELTIPEIAEIVDKFARAAQRAQKAGFDGVELNADASHLVNTFLSRAFNKRRDAYGCGDLKSRARFAVELIRETKKLVGQDFPVSVLITGVEVGLEEGITIEEAQGFAQIFQDAGADAIQVRAWFHGDNYPRGDFPEMLFDPERVKPWPKELDGSRKGAGAHVPLAAAIKEVVSIPVITVGRLDPELGEKILREGRADFIGLTRSLLADPELPHKIASGRLDDIAPCTACLHCTSFVRMQEPVRCRVNAALGSEQDYVIRQADKKKRVVVVGGGPAGMEVARVAALRGHEVTLYEREHKLGGLLAFAALVKGLEIEDLLALARYLRTQIIKLGVKIRLGKEFNPSVVEELKPDVVILAMGGIPTVPEIPGINRRNVLSNADLHRRLKIYLRFLGPKVLRWLTRFWVPLGKRVVIIGGSIHGCKLAEFLVKRGRKVTIVDTGATWGEGIPEKKSLWYFKWMDKKGITRLAEVKYEEITDKGLTIITKEGKKQTIEVDTIVPATPLAPNTELLKSLEGKVPEIYRIGDCREPSLIIEAIADGFRVARAI